MPDDLEVDFTRLSSLTNRSSAVLIAMMISLESKVLSHANTLRMQDIPHDSSQVKFDREWKEPSALQGRPYRLMEQRPSSKT